MIRAVLEIYEIAETIICVNLLALLCDWGSIEGRTVKTKGGRK